MESKDGSKQESTSQTPAPEPPSLQSESDHLVCISTCTQSSSNQSPLQQSSYSEETLILPSNRRSTSSIAQTSRATQTLLPGCRRIRSASLQSSRTQKKIVRFADSLGLDLAEVKKFREGKDPNVPVSAFADLNLTPHIPPLSVVTGVSSTNSINPGTVSKVTKLVFVAQFHEPRSDPFFKTRLNDRKVCLESVTVGKYELEGLVRTLNLGFEKRVTVRYSKDDWATSADVDGHYKRGSSNGDSDKFTFNVQLPPLRLGEKLAFCIKYEVNGQEYWDNNGSENYVIKCLVQEA